MAACTVSDSQTKRTSDCSSPLAEVLANGPRCDMQSSDIELTICYAVSGENLAKLKMSSDSYVSDLKLALKQHIGQGKIIQAFLKDDKLLQENESLEGNGLANGMEVKAVVHSKPLLFVSDSSATVDLFESHDELQNLRLGDVWIDNPQSISEAPEVACEVAKAMMAVAPGLHEMEKLAGGGPVRAGAYIVVIANPGDDRREACLQALKTPEELDEDDWSEPSFDENEPQVPPLWRCATLKDEDWSQKLRGGFNASFRDDPADQSQFSNMHPLPEPWIRVRSRSSGEMYFRNTATEESTFRSPAGWVEFVSRRTGETLYHNEALGKTQVEKPADFAVLCGTEDKCDNESEDRKQILAITKVMSEKLHKHFTFSFDHHADAAPMLYGGYASDGSIVGVLSRRRRCGFGPSEMSMLKTMFQED